MRKMAVALLAGTLGLGGVGRAVADEDEGSHEHQSVTMADVPPAAQKTHKKEARGRTSRSAPMARSWSAVRPTTRSPSRSTKASSSCRRRPPGIHDS